MKNVLVYGWFGHENIGDELFKDAFIKLFPNYNFTFVDHFTLENIENAEAIFFGGGSFLNQSINITKTELWLKLIQKKILYIGIGLETDIHKDHASLLSIAKLIASRTKNNKLDSRKYNIIEIPDLVYALNDKDFSYTCNPKSVLILPNVSVVPNHNDPHWMHASWDHFKTEMAQFLDYLIYNEYTIKFANMCQDYKEDDNFASYAICSTMINRESSNITNYVDKRMISTYGMVITQRYHGAILADMANVPCLSIYHHDKLKAENAINYYEISKIKLISKFDIIKNTPMNKNNINFSAFSQLVEKVKNIMKE